MFTLFSIVSIRTKYFNCLYFHKKKKSFGNKSIIFSESCCYILLEISLRNLSCIIFQISPIILIRLCINLKTMCTRIENMFFSNCVNIMRFFFHRNKNNSVKLMFAVLIVVYIKIEKNVV